MNMRPFAQKRLIGSSLVLLVLAAPTALAAVYRWVNEEGVVQITNELRRVPPEYRDRMRVIREEPSVEWTRRGRSLAPLAALIGGAGLFWIVGRRLRQAWNSAPDPLPGPMDDAAPRLPPPQLPAPYAVLGVLSSASPEEIHLAFRQRMREYHPDRVSDLGDELRDLAEEKAKAISEAYQSILRERGQG